MYRNTQVASAVRYALVVSAVSAGGVATPALAQQAPAAAAPVELESVVVTGSRIKQSNLEFTSPVTQVTDADIAIQGATRVEDLLNQLPQAFAAQNATVSNGASGAATIDLRGLGDARTLVLIDGRRMPYGSTTNSAADVNMIPAALVERVDILTGGASAVYGSDAIAGVVNFITKKNFEGVQVDVEYNFFNHNNAFNGPGQKQLRDVIAARQATNPAQFQLPSSSVNTGTGKIGSLLVGLNSGDGKGNVVLYAGVETNDAVLQAKYDYSACTLNNNAPKTSFSCGGSSTSYPGRFTDFATYNSTVSTAGTGNTFRNFNANLDQYNFGPLNYYLRPDQRYNLAAQGHYEANEHADVYAQLMYSDYRSVAQIAPGGIFFSGQNVNCGNPLLSANESSTIGCTPAMIAANTMQGVYIARRNVEGGGRQSVFSNSMFRGVLGIRGKIAEGWDYDAFLQRSSTSADPTTNNYFDKTRIANSLNVVSVGGVPTCQSVVNGTDPNCVPYNLWQIGGVTPAALKYLQVPGVQTGVIDQEIYNATINGDLGVYGAKLPTANESLKLVFGVEYRRDKVQNVTDLELSSYQLSGTGGPTIGIAGVTQVKDYFGEMLLPLVQGKTGAEQLGVDGAYRHSDYGNLKTDTYKFGADWAPLADVKFRGSFQRAVRAPNIIELFTAQGFNLFNAVGDPCGAAKTASLAQCVATGVPAANYGNGAILDSPAGQYNFNQGGNPNLQAETSDTTSFGVVFTPTFAHGFNASFDYFKIKVQNTISIFGSVNTLNACYTNNNAAACGRIHRNAQGALWFGTGFIDDTNVNTGALRTSGLDVNINYQGLHVGSMGTLNFNMTGTKLTELVTDNVPGIIPAYDCAGQYGTSCGGPSAKWRHHARIGWVTPWKLDFDLTWRYFGSVSAFQGNSAAIDFNLPSRSYFDLSGSYTLSPKTSIVVGINNLLDKDPPITSVPAAAVGNGNTYPGTYDSFGRFIFARIKVGF